jgi:hypothetical protein
MAGQRVAKEQAAGRAAGPAGRQVHAQFEAKIGRLFLTRMGRVCKLLRVEPPTKDRPDCLLGFGYVDLDNRVIRLGPSIDGFDMHERVASRLLTPVGKP